MRRLLPLLLLVSCKGLRAPDCQVIYDGCSDPCTPLCLDYNAIDPDEDSCDMGCADTGNTDPPGECVLVDEECGWSTP